MAVDREEAQAPHRTRLAFSRSTAISSSSHSRLGTETLGRIPVSKGRKGRPETVCRLSRKGIKVYTCRIRVQARLAGKSAIDYERRIFACERLGKMPEVRILIELRLVVEI